MKSLFMLLRCVLLTVGGTVALAQSLALNAARPGGDAAGTPLSRPISPAHLIVLEEWDARSVAAFLSGSADGLLSAHADDVRLMPAYQSTVFTKENAATYYRAFFERFEVRAYERRVLEQLDLGPRVAEFGQFEMTLAVRATGHVSTVVGKFLDLWVKSTDGHLQLSTALWSHDRSPELPELFRFKEVPGVIVAHQTQVTVDRPLHFEVAAYQALEEQVIPQRDGKRWAQFFADDAVIYANLGAVVNGRREVEEYTQRHAAELPVFEHLDIRCDQIDECGDYVIVYASHVANWRSGEVSGVNTGKNITFWRRLPGGPLKKFRSIGSYD